MRAIYFEEFNGPLTIVEFPIPTPDKGAVTIKVEATGLCRSDWHAWVGHDTDIVLPHVPGHELAGVISAIGEGVRSFAVGDRVTVPFVNGCGRCEFCKSGNAQVCPTQTQPGFTHWGSFAEYVEIKSADFNLIALPDAISFETAAGLGCRFATSFRGLTSRAKVQPGEWVAVFGCGGVGLSAVMIAKALGAKVIAVDINDAALEKAREIGADFTVNSGNSKGNHLSSNSTQSNISSIPAMTESAKKIVVTNSEGKASEMGTDLVAAIAMVTGTRNGVDVAVDALGSEMTATASIKSLRRLGRHLQLGLLPSPSGQTPLPMGRAIAYELDLLGSHGMAAVDYPEMLAMIASGKLKPDLLVEHVIDLEAGLIALQGLATSKSAGVTIIKP